MPPPKPSLPPGSARIRRGPMAVDVLGAHFTTVYNCAVRDPRISRRARGLLVELLSHSDGFGISVASLVKNGPEGRDAIRTALAELEAHGYLHRTQHHGDDGRFAETEYQITDMPHGLDVSSSPLWDGPPVAPPQPRRTPRSRPAPDKPTSAEPKSAGPPPKKTKRKKTNGEKTSRPSVDTPPGAGAGAGAGVDRRTEGRTGSGSTRTGSSAAGARPESGTPGKPPAKAEEQEREQLKHGATAAPTVPAGAPAGRRTPGAELLLAIGQERPEYLLTGRTLTDQGLVVTGMLDAGWSPELVRHIVAGRPLPPASEIRASVGAIVAARLRQAVSVGPPPPPGQHQFGFGSLTGHDLDLGHGAGSSGQTGAGRPWDAPTPTAPVYGQHEVRVMAECDGRDGGCGRPVRPGYDQCTGCLDLPWCECGAARIDPGRGEERCPDCRDAAEALSVALHATP